MQLRPYQEEARAEIQKQWDELGVKKTLLVLPTGCGKTIVFSKIIEDRVRKGERVLVLAHRSELLEQASDKLEKTTGLKTALEQAESTSINTWFNVTVGSIQTLQREKRLKQFKSNHFDTIIIDEAHHCLSNSYQKVLEHFKDSNVLGVTATPDRGDKKNLGQYFETLAYQYTLPKAVREGYLVPIKALTVPLDLDLRSVSIQSGDFKQSEVASTLDPYLEKIAEEMLNYCKDRKIVVFLPLVETSKKFRDILNQKGFNACEVNGTSEDRKEILEAFDQGKYNVLCNSMLLTEGWDCPSVDCVIVLRPTRSRALYSQMVGRGTRLSPGKKELLLLDFLWHVEKHELCRPAYLIAEDKIVAKKMSEKTEKEPKQMDLLELEEESKKESLLEREEALVKQLEEQKKKKKKFVDPLQFEMSIQDEDLAGYVPSFGWEMAPPSKEQIQKLEKYGIDSNEIQNAGKASKMLGTLHKRQIEGLTTPRQIRLLERYGFQHVGTWQFEDAKKLVERIAANHWRLPFNVDPLNYKP